MDTTPASVATQSLSSIPFSSIIGGTLGSCIQAQAQAAMTTVDFIRAVGLQVDDEGKSSAITVEFSYEDAGGVMRRLVVPLLTIVPIPYIGINTISLDFKAKIDASASSSSEQSESTAASASGSVSMRYLGQSASFSGSFSSKKDSKATQESKYSVEYTLDIKVEAGSTDMPAGLATVLQLLQGGISMQAGPKPGNVAFTAASYKLTENKVDVTFTAIGSDGTTLSGAAVTLPEATGGFTFTPAGATTDEGGKCTFTCAYDAASGSTTFPAKFTVKVQPAAEGASAISGEFTITN